MPHHSTRKESLYSMKIVTLTDYSEMSEKTADFILDFVHKKPDALLCFPAGHTSLGTFRLLADYSRKGLADFSKCRFVGLDEWLGLDKDDENNCRSFMYHHLFIPLEIDPARIEFFDVAAENLELECRRIDEYIFKNGPVDLMLLGIGMNGHLGLNEPGTSPELYSHVTELDTVTKTVGQKYFDRPVKLERGITLGLKHIMQSRTVILQASERKKAGIVKKAIEGPITPDIPASVLRRHSNAFMFMDQEAAALLDNNN